MDITQWLIPKSDLLYLLPKTKIRQTADCGSDHKLLIAKFRLKLKKVGKTMRPFRYDLNQISYDYTGGDEQIKGLDFIDEVLEKLWMELYSV